MTKFGYHVQTAADGRQGIDKFDKGSFDVVITDIRMPGMDGKGAANPIRRSKRQWTPIIAISATPWLVEGKLNDVNSILPQPFTIKTLLETVNDLSGRTVTAAV